MAVYAAMRRAGREEVADTLGWTESSCGRLRARGTLQAARAWIAGVHGLRVSKADLTRPCFSWHALGTVKGTLAARFTARRGHFARGRVLSSLRESAGVAERLGGCAHGNRSSVATPASMREQITVARSATVQISAAPGGRHTCGTVRARLVARSWHGRLCSVVATVCGSARSGVR